MFKIRIVDSNNCGRDIKVENSYTISKVKELIKKENQISGEIELIFNGIIFGDNDTLETCGISSGATLNFVGQFEAGGGLETVDVSKNITKEYKPANSGPSYRRGCNGLCIQSTCKNRSCKAYKDRIYVPIGYVENWNLLMHQEDQVICPCCKEMVKPENYWFLKCYYRIDFIKEINGRYEKNSINDYANSDKYKTFDEKKSGKATFTKLVFNVTRC